MIKRLPPKSGDEHDVVQFKRCYSYLHRPNSSARIKRGMRRRERRAARREIQRGEA